jgi:hypothetical protein
LYSLAISDFFFSHTSDGIEVFIVDKVTGEEQCPLVPPGWVEESLVREKGYLVV